MSTALLLCLLTSCVSLASAELQLSILHNNDIHSHFDPVSARTTSCRPPEPCYGGIGRLVSAVNTFKDSVPNTLVLYGGDIFQGHLYYTLFKWRVVAEMVNMVPYDAMVRRGGGKPELWHRVPDGGVNRVMDIWKSKFVQCPVLNSVGQRQWVFDKFG